MATNFFVRSAGALALGLGLLAWAAMRLAVQAEGTPTWLHAIGKMQVFTLTLALGALLLAVSGGFGLLRFARLFDGVAKEVAAEKTATEPARARRRVDAATVLAAEAEAMAARPAEPVIRSRTASEREPFGDPVAWLARQRAPVRDCIAVHWHWETDLAILKWLVEQPDCDAGTAASVFWLSGAAEDYVPFGSDEPESEDDLLVAGIEDVIGRRFTAGDFTRAEYGFDADWPFARWLERLREYHAAGRIDWDPDTIPTVPASNRTALDDLTDAERETVGAFLEWLARR
jgi:hypothetical protein